MQIADCTSKLRREQNIWREQMGEKRNKVENMERRWWIEEGVQGGGGVESGGVHFTRPADLISICFPGDPLFPATYLGFCIKHIFFLSLGNRCRCSYFKLNIFGKQHNVQKNVRVDNMQNDEYLQRLQLAHTIRPIAMVHCIFIVAVFAL